MAGTSPAMTIWEGIAHSALDLRSSVLQKAPMKFLDQCKIYVRSGNGGVGPDELAICPGDGEAFELVAGGGLEAIGVIEGDGEAAVFGVRGLKERAGPLGELLLINVVQDNRRESRGEGGLVRSSG